MVSLLTDHPLISALMLQRVGHTGRLLQDLLGALIFLIAIIAALAYVLNTTKPYQLDDWISIDGTEGRVTDIDWRATRLQTAQGSMAVIPNSLAAKAKIINFSRPSDMHGLSISLHVSPHARPRTVIEALERAMQGCRPLLGKPARMSRSKVPAARGRSTRSAVSWSPWRRKKPSART